MKPLSVAIVTSSTVIAWGVTAMLQRMRSFPIGDIRTIEPDKLEKEIERNPSRMLIVDPISVDRPRIEVLRESLVPSTIFVAMCSSLLPQEIVNTYDHTVSIYDDPAVLSDIIAKVCAEPVETDETKTLSQREKEVVLGIVKGLSNKEIAAEMNVSVNTVMTHRRNITAKLQIHSAAGLTIYAIVSKLVRLDEISTRLPI